jgi:hypothetical protein
MVQTHAPVALAYSHSNICGDRKPHLHVRIVKVGAIVPGELHNRPTTDDEAFLGLRNAEYGDAASSSKRRAPTFWSIFRPRNSRLKPSRSLLKRNGTPCISLVTRLDRLPAHLFLLASTIPRASSLLRFERIRMIRCGQTIGA